MAKTKELKAKDREALLKTLQTRFEKNPKRHPGQKWATVLAKLDVNPEKLVALQAMEETGGEPDVVELVPKSKDLVFVDCSAESPKDRRSLCFDRAALDARKENKPKGNALEAATDMGVELISEEDYRALQAVGEFDLKTSSWIQTPASVRKLGGALFCDRRYDTVFVYHNGAESYYAARGFRGKLVI
jgi:Protein of unknown function (DUF4256)